jgi:YVTN family beta-propeller protein
MNIEQLRFLATLMSLSLCACGGGNGGGTSQSPTTSPVSSGSGSSGSSTNPIPTISTLYPSCAPAGEQLVNGANNQLLVIGPNAFAAGSVVRWNGSDRPTTNDGINSLTAQISGTDIAAAGTAVVTVFNPAPGGGTSNSLTFTITTGAVDPQSIAVDPAGKFAYVMNSGCTGGAGGYVSMYTINSTSGAPASIGPPVWTYDYGGYPGSVTVAPSGKFVYVTNSGDVWDPDYGSVVMYSLDATTGALTSTGTIAGNCPGLCFPSSLVVDPSGKFAYVATGGTPIPFSVAMYTINATTGALTSIGTISTGPAAVSVGVDPAGKYVYVVNEDGNVGSAGNVSMYAINAPTGALASIGTIAAGTAPVSIAVDPSDKFAYVTNSGSNDVSIYTIDATTGALTSTGTIAAGTAPVFVAVDPSDKFAYVVNSGSNDVSMYTINSTTGSLTPIGTTATGLAPTSIAIHPSGKFVYVTNSGSNEVSTYSIGSNGTLALIATTGT